jgi:predicted dehydrogenase
MSPTRRQVLSGAGASALSTAVHLANAQEAIATGAVVIGCGNRGKLLVEAAEREKLAMSWAGFCDIAPEKAQKLAVAFAPAAPVFESVDKLLAAKPAARIAIVATYSNTHLPIARKLVEAGYFVYLEKPMVVSLDEARELIRLDEAAGGRVQVGLQMRHMPLYLRAAELLKGGAVGSIREIVANEIRGDWFRFWLNDAAREKRENWRYFNATTGGSILEKLCHDLDIHARLIATKPLWVQAKGGKAVWRDRETIDHATILVGYENDLTVTLNFNLISPFLSTKTQIFGDAGALAFDRTGTLIEQWTKLWPPAGNPDRVLDVNPEKRSVAGYLGSAEGLQVLLDAASGKGTISPTPRDAWTSMALCMAATRSVNEGNTQIDLDQPIYRI